MFKIKRGIFVIIAAFVCLMYPLAAQSLERNRLMSPDSGMNNQGMLPGLLTPSMNIPLDPLISAVGAIPSVGMAMTPILGVGIPPTTINLINEPFIAMNGMNVLAPAVGATMPFMRASPSAPPLLALNNPLMGNQGLLPSLNLGISPAMGIGMLPAMEMLMAGPTMGVPGPMMMPTTMMVLAGPMAGMQDPRMMLPGPMMGMPGPMMGMPGPMMGMPGPMMGMPNPMMGMPNPMMGMPWSMMGSHDPMMGMPAPMVTMPMPMMNFPYISPLQQNPQTITTPSPTTLVRTANIVAVPLTGDSCTVCHADLLRMTDLGFPEFYIDPALVAAETGMPATCEDCHLGNPADFTVDGAHVGLLGLLLMRNQYRDIVRRKDVVGLEYELVRSIQSIRASNTDDPRSRLRVQSPFHMLLWHDRNLITASWNPDISMQTCGRCHPAEVAEFNTTEMGLVQTMSQYIPWIAPPVPGGLGTHLAVAPQSCSLWTAATTPPNNDLFTDENRLLYNATSTRIATQFFDFRYPETSGDPLTRLQAQSAQINCNKCHPGCLDCHYAPFEENIPAAMGPGVKPAGTHTVAGRPLVMNCMGMGRGQFCHAGPIDRRRGDGYLKGAFAHIPPVDLRTPETQTYLNTPDIHYNGDLLPENASCVDCHGPLMGAGPPGIHGDMNRNPEPIRCAVCHPATVAAYLAGTHRNLTCGACHTSKIVGYAFNFWSPGTRWGITPNPLDRHARYAVNAMTPVLLIDENGMWAPYHVVPHISTHIDPLYLLIDNYLSPRILWRNQPDIGVIRQHPSKDGVAVTGSYNGPLFARDEGQVMVWLNIDKMAHNITSMISPLPPRNCIDCHTPSGTQRILVSFGWNDVPALMYEELYMGTFDIVADGLGLRIENLTSGTPSTALDPMIGKWGVPGSYIIPQPIGPAVGHPSGII